MPIYRFYRLRWTDAWYKLDEEEQQALLNEVVAARDSVGGHHLLDCETNWSTESWHLFGVEEYPSVDAIRRYRHRLDELGWRLYAESESMVGTCQDSQGGSWFRVR